MRPKKILTDVFAIVVVSLLCAFPVQRVFTQRPMEWYEAWYIVFCVLAFIKAARL